VQRLLGDVRPAYLPVLLTYFCYGASGITGVALVFFQKDVLALTPAEAARIAFWLGLPWSMKMVAGVASDVYPIAGSRRAAYLVLGTLATLAGYAALVTVVQSPGTYLVASLLVAIGYMVQDVVADALSVEVARTEAEIGQIQALGRMALLAGAISVGYLSGWVAGRIGSRGTFALAMALPVLVAVGALSVHDGARPRPRPEAPGPLGGGRARVVLAVGLSYAAFGILLEAARVPFGQELVLVVSAGLIGLLFKRVGISRPVAVAAIVIFLFRATPSVGLLVFRKSIVTRPVSVTFLWVMVAGTLLYLPNIGLFYGLHDWLGISARTLAFIDTTISAPLGQLTMVPMLVLIARSAPPGAEATMFAIMASLMNLALSASELFTRHLNTAFAVTQQDYSNLGSLMLTVTGLGLVPLLALPLLRREERAGVPKTATAPVATPPR